MSNLDFKTEILELVNRLGNIWQGIYDSVTQLEKELSESRREIKDLKYLISNAPVMYH